MFQYVSHSKYTLIHKYYVFLECLKRGIFWRGVFHDISKFRPSEFITYANYFFDTDGTRKDPKLNEKKLQEEFALAWCYHQNRNDHHWNYWVTDSHNASDFKSVVMPPIPAIAEMAADMIGASTAQGHPEPARGAREYYLKHKDRMVMHPSARIILEIELGVEN
jgi:hypothetical protein